LDALNNSVQIPAIAESRLCRPSRSPSRLAGRVGQLRIGFRTEQQPSLATCIKVAMDRKPKYVAQIDNIYLVKRIGASLREATADTVRDRLPENIQLLLRRLERLEAKDSRKKETD
jgi:hypothetical protein